LSEWRSSDAKFLELESCSILIKEHDMPDVSRRQFLRTTSIGAAAAGVLAVGGHSLLTAVETTVGAAPAAPPASTDDALLEDSDVFARVVDAKAGHIRIFIGTKAVDYTDQALAQTLLRAAQ
jgi:hypothetical protein